MERVDNLTPFAAVDLLSLDFEDRQLVVVVVAARFTMPSPAQKGRLPTTADEQRPVPLADEYCGDARASSLRCEGQTTHIRPGTDIYLEGHAWAPNGRPSERSTVSLAVGRA